MTDPLRADGTDLSTLRRLIDEMLDELVWDPPFDLDRLLGQISARRGKRISLYPAALPRDGAGGLVIERAKDLVIVFDETLPPLQQEHVIMHEAAHILFEHSGTSLEDLTGDEFTELDPELVETAQRFARRDGYSGAEEKVAEIAAALMWMRAGAARSMVPAPHRSRAVAEANARFEAALMNRRTSS
ncbi:ImmA/IrrE family metallo-endopeptidase [Lentzea sp. PSKA42]|uniref:ImmA/IrrE family metallo-endopeptidase n=1 Tax=Lentzea indica TaxID=2604800 RepID=A0ABX1FXI2_9PSEU|nr:ImmA/IrrE family metallo-endopeptidase [Lentzea indica]NKE63771.1 ImmA/IrrE family metallo-endopeptidase [Lentzea indica]